MSKGNATKSRIVETALRAASVGGLEGITLGKVAADVGMSKSGLFAHFDSKETLQVDVLNAAAEKFAEVVVAPALTAPRGEPRLRALFDHWMEWEQHESLPGGCVFMHASAELDDRPGPARDALVDHQRRWMETLAKAVRLTIEVGHFRADVDSATLCVPALRHRAELLPLGPTLQGSRREVTRGCCVRVGGRCGQTDRRVAEPFAQIPVSPNGSPVAKNSTTDRPVPLPVRALRLWFALESRFSPRTAERRAARMFATPPRQKSRKIVSGVRSDASTRAYSVELRDGHFRVSATTFGDGPPAMLLHGWGGSANDMLPLAWAFARAGWRSVVFDMPGHGRSPRRESSLVEFLRAMRLVAGALGDPEIIVGHSFGGAAAVFGITELRLPVRAAVLFSPAPGPAYYVDRFVRAVGLPAERTDGMVRQLVERVGRPMESLDALVAARVGDCARRSSFTTREIARCRSSSRSRCARRGEAAVSCRHRRSVTSAFFAMRQ